MNAVRRVSNLQFTTHMIDKGSEWSMSIMSCEKRFVMLPVSVLVKNDIGALKV